MMSLPSRTPVTDGGGIVRRVPNRAISPLLVPAIIAQITGTSALILIAISASGLVLTNVMATTATGNDAIGLRCVAVSDLFSGQRADMLNFIRNVCFDPKWTFGEAKPLSALKSIQDGFHLVRRDGQEIAVLTGYNTRKRGYVRGDWSTFDV